jgi:hypothetical protein
MWTVGAFMSKLEHDGTFWLLKLKLALQGTRRMGRERGSAPVLRCTPGIWLWLPSTQLVLLERNSN